MTNGTFVSSTPAEQPIYRAPRVAGRCRCSLRIHRAVITFEHFIERSDAPRGTGNFAGVLDTSELVATLAPTRACSARASAVAPSTASPGRSRKPRTSSTTRRTCRTSRATPSRSASGSPPSSSRTRPRWHPTRHRRPIRALRCDLKPRARRTARRARRGLGVRRRARDRRPRDRARDGRDRGAASRRARWSPCRRAREARARGSARAISREGDGRGRALPPAARRGPEAIGDALRRASVAPRR